MTGFGKGVASSDGGEFAIEVRSVNHRQIEVRASGPRELVPFFSKAEQAIRARFNRGRFDAHVRFSALTSNSAERNGLSIGRAKATYAALLALRDEIAPEEAVPFAALLSMPQLFAIDHDFEDIAIQGAFERAIGSALQSLQSSREAEGAALKTEFQMRLASMGETVSKLKKVFSLALADYHARMQARIQGWVSKDELLDPTRIAQELALAAERADITEEMARLVAHIDAALVAIDSDGPCGRRLDFLLQEMGREANTLGAKSLTAEISHLSIELRAEIERMREQAQNIE